MIGLSFSQYFRTVMLRFIVMPLVCKNFHVDLTKELVVKELNSGYGSVSNASPKPDYRIMFSRDA
jgi:hypothetical protein